MKLDEACLTFLDLQTTGATPKSGNVLELAWCTAAASAEAPTGFGAYLIKQPEDAPIPGRISAITGIKNDEMERAVPVSRALRQMLRQARSTDAANVMVIHFAQFEKPFLANLLPKRFEKLKIYCTHQIAARLFPNLPSRGIRGLAGYFGLCLEECKRAESHAWATFLIWQNLCRKLAEQDIHTFDQLDDWLATTPLQKRTKYEYPVEKQLRLGLPDQPGVYRMVAGNGKILYVGKATSLHSRVNSYFRGRRGKDPRKLEMLTQTRDINYTVCDTVVEACVLEAELIKSLSPPYNIALKIDSRPLVFYNWEFDSVANDQDAIHCVGPFRSEFVMDQLIRFKSSINTDCFDPLMFFDPLPVELLEEAFEVFLERHGLSRMSLLSARNLLALGLWFRRRYAAELEEADEEASQETAGNVTAEIGESVEHLKGEDGPIPSFDIEPDEPSPEEVADKYERLLMRAAGAYLLAKRLTRLLNAEVTFEECGQIHKVRTRRGRLHFRMTTVPDNEQCESFSVNECSEHDWQGLAIEAFDRLRVLNTELSRILAAGQTVAF